MNSTEKELQVGFTRSKSTGLKGKRERHVLTFTPNKYSPGEVIRLDVPTLDDSSCIVPGSIHLLYDFDVTGSKTHFLNNLSKQLQKRLEISIQGRTIYNNSEEAMYNTYKDLWKTTKQERDNLIEYGVASANLRKIISGDDSAAAANSGATAKEEHLIHGIYGKKQRMSVNKILEDHGLYAPHNMSHSFHYEITLPQASEVLVAQKSQTLGTYELQNVQLEYETIENKDIADTISASYTQSRSLHYEEVIHHKTFTCEASTTLVNEKINIPRSSMKAIIFLFKKAALTDSEEFVYPNIEKVQVDVEGKPFQLYSAGMGKERLYKEAKRFFAPNDDKDITVNDRKFYNNKFALVIDLRSHKGEHNTNHGRNIVSHQNGVDVKIQKKAHTGDLECSIFVVSDGLCKFANNTFYGHELVSKNSGT